jgi:hypothetical protein
MSTGAQRAAERIQKDIAVNGGHQSEYSACMWSAIQSETCADELVNALECALPEIEALYDQGDIHEDEGQLNRLGFIKRKIESAIAKYRGSK